MAARRDPAEQAQARLLAPAGGITSTLDRAHLLDEAPNHSDEHVRNGDTTDQSTHRTHCRQARTRLPRSHRDPSSAMIPLSPTLDTVCSSTCVGVWHPSPVTCNVRMWLAVDQGCRWSIGCVSTAGGCALRAFDRSRFGCLTYDRPSSPNRRTSSPPKSPRVARRTTISASSTPSARTRSETR